MTKAWKVSNVSTLLLLLFVVYYMKYGAILYHIGTLLFCYPKEVVFATVVYRYRFRALKWVRVVVNWISHIK